jgi:glucose/arabinose dehydrogenase
MGRLMRISILGLVAIGLLAVPASQAAIGAQQVVATSWPAAFTFDPGGRIFYGKRFTGEIRIFNPATGGDTLFFTLPNVATAGEQGLLGLALHPSYPQNPYVFAYYTRTVGGNPQNQIVRLTDSMGTGKGFRTLLPLPASSNHNGGVIHFGPDNRLYAVIGDAGNPPMPRISPRSRARYCECRPSANPYPVTPLAAATSGPSGSETASASPSIPRPEMFGRPRTGPSATTS